MMEDLQKRLNPLVIKKNLILASLYLMAYEMLEDAIVKKLKEFYNLGFEDGTPENCSDYKKDVLSLDKKSPLFASCLWFMKAEAITKSDVDDIRLIKTHRNMVAHELLKLLVEPDENINMSHFLQMRKLLQKLQGWWIANMESGVNPDLDGIEIDEGEAHFIELDMLDYIIDVSRSVTVSYPPISDTFSNN